MRADIDSPFSPGQIVNPDLFVGRNDELTSLDDKLRATARGKTQVAFLTGPRGIGKSSLAAKARQIAVQKHGLVGIHVFLGGAKTVEEMVKIVLSKLLNESSRFPWFEKARSLFGKGVKGLDLFGLKFDFQPAPDELTNLTQNFSLAIANFLAKLGDDVKGLFLVLDDINGLADQPDFANWLKATVDEMRTLTPVPKVFLILSGLSGRRDALLKNQPSLDRILDIVPVETWKVPDSKHFFFSTFQSAGIECSIEAADLLGTFCGGFPVMAHEMGDATFYAWRNSEVAVVDRQLAILSTREAAKEIGRKYLDSQFLGAIRSDRYLTVLKAITQTPNLQFSRKSVCEGLPKSEEAIFDNFVRKMKALGFFIEAGDRGTYRWVNPMHWAYLALRESSQTPDVPLEDLQQLQLEQSSGHPEVDDDAKRGKEKD